MSPELLLAVGTLMYKVYKDIAAGDPLNVQEEIKALEAARLRSSQDIIDEADKGA